MVFRRRNLSGSVTRTTIWMMGLFLWITMMMETTTRSCLACQSCLFPMLHHHHPSKHQSVSSGGGRGIITTLRTGSSSSTSSLPLVAGMAALIRRNNNIRNVAILTAAGALAARQQQRRRWIFFSEQEDDDSKEQDSKESSQDDDDSSSNKPPLTAAMVGSIGFYKNFISPLLPPACRFLPTCSQYGVQAIEEFGPTKGAILTAWRLLRCSPFGGKGYDPPKWPPVAFTYSSW